MNAKMWTCPCHLPRPQFKAWVSHKPRAVLWGTHGTLPEETWSRALGRRPPQRQSPLQAQCPALHHQVFDLVQLLTVFHSRGTRPLPRAVILCSPLSSQRERSKLAPPQLKFSALTSPPWLWEPALLWSWSQPHHRLGTAGTDTWPAPSTASLPVPVMGLLTAPSLPQKGVTKEQLIFLQRLQQAPQPQKCSWPLLWSTQEILEHHHIQFQWSCCCQCFKTGWHAKIIIKIESWALFLLMTTFYIQFKHVLHTFFHYKKGKDNLIIIWEPRGQISSYFSLFLLKLEEEECFYSPDHIPTNI